MIWAILAFTPTILYLLIWVVPGALCRPSAVSVTRGPDLAALFDVARAEREMKLPLAELVAQAERKAIAMHGPLAGDPHQAQVVANRPDPTWNGHAPEPPSPIEITAFGDRDRSFIDPSDGRRFSELYGTRVVPDCFRIPLLRLRDERLRVWGQLKILTEAGGEFSRAEEHLWGVLNEQMRVLDEQIACVQRMADHL